jgi:hypothetical protein
VDVGEMSVANAHPDLETSVGLDNVNGGNLVPDAGWHFRKRTRIPRWSTYELLLSPGMNALSIAKVKAAIICMMLGVMECRSSRGQSRYGPQGMRLPY